MSHIVLDILGAGCSLTATILYVRQHVIAWPVSLVAIALNATLFWQKGIYGEFGLELVYALLCLYGWYCWHRGKQHQPVHVSVLKNKARLGLASLTFVGFLVCTFALRTLTDSTIPLRDGFTTSGSILAQWLTARKHIECWLLWFVIDFVYMSLYLAKGLPFHAVLMLIYLGLAVLGFKAWRKDLETT